MFINDLSVEVLPERVTADEKTNGRKLVVLRRPVGHEQHLRDPGELEGLARYLMGEAHTWQAEIEGRTQC